MKVFVINLDKDVERWAAVTAQLEALHVAYERIAAVYTKDMPRDEKKRAVNAFRWKCIVGKSPLDGEIGCALSHFSVYRRLLDSDLKGEKCVCILEDDVILDRRFSNVLTEIEERMDSSRPQVFLLSNHRRNTGIGSWHTGYLSPDEIGFGLERLSDEQYAEGYVLTRRAAELLLRLNYPLKTPCDNWGRWVRLGALELYRVYPTVCSQNKEGFESSIVEQWGNLVKNWPWYRRLPHKALRALEKAIDFLLQKATGT